ncbi:ABC-2 type transport system ATP-binding protein [Isoptericola sp. CG 20/1183]|uniref:ABC-2 type transport system ATP-binding protein n=1 Tax=Isoptericola halotolerans TaxID=300560 RepID=A0ABX5EK11_9MICO|nr:MULTISPECIES: ABC transporter ATP-binding protein [Isoptericola]PRZ04124.1 ABC-2 type transport system ATP-binding protein [Isoptericola sp. CG 20/1183]PRZ10051.1 ABC-2 type transport system ATP-binding protein [Isoptericola halotolerans]
MNSTTTGTTAPAIEIHDLHKSFGAVQALDGLDLTVTHGQVAGFLGPNGAGKSTAIRVLLGLLRKDSGQVRLLGGDPWSDAVALHRRLAYVPGDVSLWPNLSGGESIDYLARLRGKVDTKRKDELLERFGLDPTKKTRTYSKGNRQKVALVSAFMSDVDLLVLDEPTSGLDPLMEAVFMEYVREAKDRGTSVLLSSHILSEVEKVCDTVTIIRQGRAVESGTLEELRHLTRSSVTTVVAGDPAALSALPGVHDVATVGTDEGTRVTFDVDNAQIGGVLTALSTLDVRSFTAAPPSLEELFLRHYGEDVSDAAAGSDAGSDDGTHVRPDDRPGKHTRAGSKAGAR